MLNYGDTVSSNKFFIYFLTCHDHTQLQKEISINATFLVRMKKAATKTVHITLGVWIRWQSYFYSYLTK